MASSADFVAYVVEQISDAGNIEAKKMFGDYAIYCDGKVIGFVCDNQFFLKPSQATTERLAGATPGSPYPGAKPHVVLDAQLDDRRLASELARLTADALPAPKPKKPKAPARRPRAKA